MTDSNLVNLRATSERLAFSQAGRISTLHFLRSIEDILPQVGLEKMDD